MNPTRILAFSAALLLAACSSEPTQEEAEQKFAEFHNPCLAPGRPAYSPAHTDCVIASYWERQQQLERLRYAAITPPMMLPVVYPAPAPQSAPAPYSAPAAVVPPPPPAVAPPPPAVEPAPRNPETGLYPGTDVYFSSAP